MKNILKKPMIATALAMGLLGVVSGAEAQTKIDFYFPAGVQGPVARNMQELVSQFNESQDEIEVVAAYTGNYTQTKTKAQAAIAAGAPPALALMSANLTLELVLDEQIVSIEGLLEAENQDRDTFLSDFWPALHKNAIVNDTLYAIPFQNSTPLLYINAEHFREVGLDPENPPSTWDELLDAAQKLTQRDGDEVTRYGIVLPQSSSYLSWVFQAFVMANGGDFFNADTGAEVYFDSAETTDALTFYRALAYEHNVMPQSITDSKQVSTFFISGKASMMILSTGAMGFVRDNAPFDYQVGFVPGNVRNAVPIGGGSVVIFKGQEPEKLAAAWTFAKWLTDAPQLGFWSRATGYFAPRQSSYEIEEMQEFLAENPDASTAVQQLPYAQPWLATYKTIAVRTALEDELQQVIAGQKTVEEGLADAQAKAEEILQPYVDTLQ
ncbi:MAG: ABC transporter substrate-binding protein [Paracoccaceae bacterium]